jgi:hypothetical protein
MYFDCDNCLKSNRVTIKDEELKLYYCSYCGNSQKN